MKKIHNLNVQSFQKLITPEEILKTIALPPESQETVLRARSIVQDIIKHQDKRKLIIVGPCSIHDPVAAKEYASRLLVLAKKVEDRFFVVMRTYFEKPRTTVGWKGYVNDPFLNNTFDVGEGLLRSRQLLCDITKMGMPVATEALDPIVPQYLSDLICWTAIGARTTESQTHREMASGLSSPVGFKNNTDGNISVAINAIKSAGQKHWFLGIDQEGCTAVVETCGNSCCHLILRGGAKGPNYDSVSIKQAELALEKAGLNQTIVIDCSHDNSNKDYLLQPLVLNDCINQIIAGNQSIVGFMLESYLHAGNQPLSSELKYGISITDECIDWSDTEKAIMLAFSRIKTINF
jgi:3-deoxy-7-phosphoheptulonate synthase